MTSTLTTTAFVLLLTHGALSQGVETANEKTIVNVDVYYEALCGDSIHFIKNQLVPTYPKLKDHLKINLYPYGKAGHRRDEETGRWTFTCQHGPAECRGNRAQACALSAIYDKEAVQDRQDLAVNLVGCVMSSSNPSTAVPRCAQSVGLSSATTNSISECQSSTLGDDLLATIGDKTLALDPILTFVPTIIVNGVHPSENSTAALRNFQSLICGLIPQDEKPEVCKSS